MSSDPGGERRSSKRDPEATPEGPFLASRRAALPGETGVRFAPAAVEIQGSRFGAVLELAGDFTEAVEGLRRRGRVVEDLGDLILTPAFVNPHTHVVLSFLRAVPSAPIAGGGNLVEDLFFRVEAALTPADVRAFARMGAYESLLCGVGVVWDHYYEAVEVAEALIDVGLSGVVAPTLQDLAGPGRDATDAQLEATLTLTGERFARAGVFAAVGPHATDTVSDALWDRATALAEANGLPLHAHCAQSIEEYERACDRWGTPPLSALATLGVLERAPSVVLAHDLFVTRAELGLLDSKRHTLIACPHAQLVFGFPADVSAFEAAGATWAVATDCAASNDSMNLQKELRMVAGFSTAAVTASEPYQRFLTTGERSAAIETWRVRAKRTAEAQSMRRPERLLDRAWSIPGALHPAFRAGALAPGALAHAVAWDPDHPSMWPARDPAQILALGDTTSAIHSMWILGKPIGTPGSFHESIVGSERYREARREASDRLDLLLARTGTLQK